VVCLGKARARGGQAIGVRFAAPLTALAIAAAVAGCGGGNHAAASHTLPQSGPFFSNLASVRAALSHDGVAVAQLAPGAPPQSVLPQPGRSYRVRTRGGTHASVLIYGSPQKALRAQASAGPLTVLGDNVLAVIGHRGTDIGRVRAAVGSLDHRPS
jgi:hypothetical protein